MCCVINFMHILKEAISWMVKLLFCFLTCLLYGKIFIVTVSELEQPITSVFRPKTIP